MFWGDLILDRITVMIRDDVLTSDISISIKMGIENNQNLSMQTINFIEYNMRNEIRKIEERYSASDDLYGFMNTDKTGWVYTITFTDVEKLVNFIKENKKHLEMRKMQVRLVDGKSVVDLHDINIRSSKHIQNIINTNRLSSESKEDILNEFCRIVDMIKTM